MPRKGRPRCDELARARGRRGVPSGTFNTMKLRSPVVEFRNSKARVCARSVADHRWYAVQGITKTLDSIACSRKRARAHNMICMDLFARILRDLNDNPGTSLRWLLEYVVNLNAPESKAADFRSALLRLLKYKALSLKSVRRTWDANRLSPSIGIAVDAQCKDVFNGKKSADEVGPVSRVILTQLQALHLSPICAGLKVAGVPTPDRSGDGGGGGGGGRYTYHNGCVRGCRSLRGRDAFYTEVDLGCCPALRSFTKTSSASWRTTGEPRSDQKRNLGNAVRYVFETLCDTGEKQREETPTRAGSSQKKKKKKRKRQRDPGSAAEEGSAEPGMRGGSGADGAEAMLGEPRKLVTFSMACMAKAYMNGAVPRASHARFLRLSRVGRHMFLRVKTAVVHDERVRAERVLFMALCGTDYSMTAVGLGIKRLLTGAVANRELFSSWCAQLKSSLWAPPDGTREEAREPPDFHGMAVALAGFTGIPPKIRDKHWTGAKCELMFRTLKYVCDLWALKKPQIGPEYGFSVHDDGALHLSPICAGLKVAGVPTPDRSGDGGGGGSCYKYHNGCIRGCCSLRRRDAFYTEVDLVAHDMMTNTVALLELKTRNNDVLDDATLWRYNTQLWLTWTMFSLTYPSTAERSSAYLVIIRPGTSTVTIRSCMRPTVSKTLRDKFPWLNCLCPQVLNCLTPACVNMRVGTRLNSGSAGGRRRKRSGVDPSDLCFRNMMFNQEKARVSAAVVERKSVEN
ncbi:hypothetical protein Q5P01_010709 [Channa striata]|uniref:Uncharacterized protein n=1 Tax=Channa striata TaxID=64152 RepID=A0AA88MS60_CHASR|nr:hypothetical protein Q5P01_010709 [Channa striata]